jgi:hypothetical protein
MDIVRDPGLSLVEKRTMLASWASDARAVESAPDLRTTDDGTPVPVDDVLAALRVLDGIERNIGRPIPRYRRILARGKHRGADAAKVRADNHARQGAAPKPAHRRLSVEQAKAIVAEEASRISREVEVKPDSVVLVGDRTRWMATLRPERPRLDEAALAAVAEASLRIAREFELDT